jgi:hypothetical protein
VVGIGTWELGIKHGRAVLARGSAITLLAYAFHLLRQGPKPGVNVASHLIFGNAVAFLDFAF